MDIPTNHRIEGIQLWNSVLGAALKLPGARVERAAFLKSSLGKVAGAALAARAAESSPAEAGVPEDVIQRAAESAIKFHRTGVSVLSVAAGLPGGWWVAGTIPADLAQYLWHMIVVSQKLAYLYGWPDLIPEDEDMDDETKLILTLFIGVTMGAEGAATGINRLAHALRDQAVKRLSQASLTKYMIYKLAKQAAQWLGISLTKKKFAEYIGRAIPVIGGIVAGGSTWALFGAGSKRLHSHLASLPAAKSDRSTSAPT